MRLSYLSMIRKLEMSQVETLRQPRPNTELTNSWTQSEYKPFPCKQASLAEQKRPDHWHVSSEYYVRKSSEAVLGVVLSDGRSAESPSSTLRVRLGIDGKKMFREEFPFLGKG